MFRANRRLGFTLVEVLIVVVIMAVLAATIIPQFTDASGDAKVSSGKTNLGTIKSVLALYKAQHNGNFPANSATVSLETALTSKTTPAGVVDAAAGTCGPYLQEFPGDPFANLKTVTNSAASPIAAPAANTTTGGYNYNPTTGEIRFNYNTTQFPAYTY